MSPAVPGKAFWWRRHLHWDSEVETLQRGLVIATTPPLTLRGQALRLRRAGWNGDHVPGHTRNDHCAVDSRRRLALANKHVPRNSLKLVFGQEATQGTRARGRSCPLPPPAGRSARSRGVTIRPAGTGSRGHGPCPCGDWLPRVRCVCPGPTSEGGVSPRISSSPAAGRGRGGGRPRCPLHPTPAPGALLPPTCPAQLWERCFKAGSGFFGGDNDTNLCRVPRPCGSDPPASPLASSLLLTQLLQPSGLPLPALERQAFPQLVPSASPALSLLVSSLLLACSY